MKTFLFLLGLVVSFTENSVCSDDLHVNVGITKLNEQIEDAIIQQQELYANAKEQLQKAVAHMALDLISENSKLDNIIDKAYHQAKHRESILSKYYACKKIHDRKIGKVYKYEKVLKCIDNFSREEFNKSLNKLRAVRRQLNSAENVEETQQSFEQALEEINQFISNTLVSSKSCAAESKDSYIKIMGSLAKKFEKCMSS